MKVQNIRHTGLRVSNLQRSIEFYRKLGFLTIQRKIEKWNGKQLKICKMFIASQNQFIELVEGDWPHHIALTVDEMPNGGVDKSDNYHDIKFIQDPDGNRIELVLEQIKMK